MQQRNSLDMTRSDKFKYWIAKKIFDSKLQNRLYSVDAGIIERQRADNKSYFQDEDSTPIQKFSISNIYVSELFRINDFQKIRNGILKLAKNKNAESTSFIELDFDDLIGELSDITNGIGTARFGKFLSLDFSKTGNSLI